MRYHYWKILNRLNSIDLWHNRKLPKGHFVFNTGLKYKNIIWPMITVTSFKQDDYQVHLKLEYSIWTLWTTGIEETEWLFQNVILVANKPYKQTWTILLKLSYISKRFVRVSLLLQVRPCHISISWLVDRMPKALTMTNVDRKEKNAECTYIWMFVLQRTQERLKVRAPKVSDWLKAGEERSVRNLLEMSLTDILQITEREAGI